MPAASWCFGSSQLRRPVADPGEFCKGNELLYLEFFRCLFLNFPDNPSLSDFVKRLARGAEDTATVACAKEATEEAANKRVTPITREAQERA
jgi:hypothetical protein